MDRRDFIGALSATAGYYVLARAREVSARDAGSGAGKPPTVLGAFVYPPTAELDSVGYYSWPGSTFDAEGRQRQYMRSIRDMAERLGIDILMREQPVADESDAQTFIEEVQVKKPDGLLLIPFKKSHWDQVTKIVDEEDLKALRERLIASVEDVKTCAEIFATFENPALDREMEFVAVTNPGTYEFVEGRVKSSLGTEVDEMDYLDLITEHVEPHSTSKHVATANGDYTVGALARYEINHEWLCDMSKAVAEQIGLKPGTNNIFFNNQAQVVEIVECTVDALAVIDELLERGLDYDDIVGAGPDAVEWTPGRGSAAVDVPRGILFHDYTVDEKGLISDCNLIIPTGQNYGSIEANMRTLVPTILDKPKEEIALTLEMLVRAYDPCISCSVHLLNVEFVE